MSARSRDLPRRSCLSVPGSSERFLEKAPTVPADMTFLDLEDIEDASRPILVNHSRVVYDFTREEGVLQRAAHDGLDGRP